MYDGDSLVNIADCLCPEDIYLSICLPSLVILIGSLLISWVILASKLTEKFSATKRNVLLAVFAIAFLTALVVSSKIATDQDWARARAAEDDYFKRMKTNTPATTLEKSKHIH
jgi:archaellum biogenesis protein FlaJ (TadC family)